MLVWIREAGLNFTTAFSISAYISEYRVQILRIELFLQLTLECPVKSITSWKIKRYGQDSAAFVRGFTRCHREHPNPRRPSRPRRPFQRDIRHAKYLWFDIHIRLKRSDKGVDRLINR